MALPELAAHFGRSVSWASRRVGLVEALPEAVQQQVQAGSISAYAAMKWLVPLARAHAAQCAALVAALAPAKLAATKERRMMTPLRHGNRHGHGRAVAARAVAASPATNRNDMANALTVELPAPTATGQPAVQSLGNRTLPLHRSGRP